MPAKATSGISSQEFSRGIVREGVSGEQHPDLLSGNL